MIQSRFDSFVEKILKESLASGNYNTTSITPVRSPSQLSANKNQKQDHNQQEQLPLPDNQENQQPPKIQNTNTASSDTNSTQSINALINQMKENAKKEEEFQKKLIATQTAASKNVAATPATTAQTPQTNVLGTGNLDIKQILGNLGVK